LTDRKPHQLRMYRPHLNDLHTGTPLPAGYGLRTAHGPDDEIALAGVLAASFAEEWTVDRVRQQLTAAPEVLAVYVATWGDEPVATAASRWVPHRFPETGYVHWVGTDPGHARRGLGLGLMLRVLQDFKDRGYRHAILETDDFRLPAIRTYLRCGFVPVADVDGEDHRDRWSAIFQAIFTPDPGDTRAA
jgi:mycothiol synthase